MWPKIVDDMFGCCEGYRLIDVVHINGKEIVIGKNGNFPKPFATFEREDDTAPYEKGRYFAKQRDAVADLCKRAEKEILNEKSQEQQPSKKKNRDYER